LMPPEGSRPHATRSSSTTAAVRMSSVPDRSTTGPNSCRVFGSSRRMMMLQPSTSRSSDPGPATGRSNCVAISDEVSRFSGLREVRGDPSQWLPARRDSRGPRSQ
jgi:hypothetical protein